MVLLTMWQRLYAHHGILLLISREGEDDITAHMVILSIWQEVYTTV